MVGKAGRQELLCVVAEACSMGYSHLRRPESKIPEAAPWSGRDARASNLLCQARSGLRKLTGPLGMVLPATSNP